MHIQSEKLIKKVCGMMQLYFFNNRCLHKLNYLIINNLHKTAAPPGFLFVSLPFFSLSEFSSFSFFRFLPRRKSIKKPFFFSISSKSNFQVFFSTFLASVKYWFYWGSQGFKLLYYPLMLQIYRYLYQIYPFFHPFVTIFLLQYFKCVTFDF